MQALKITFLTGKVPGDLGRYLSNGAKLNDHVLTIPYPTSAQALAGVSELGLQLNRIQSIVDCGSGKTIWPLSDGA